ncbi:glutamate-5-semialdehyde dehydrogenase [Naumannella halotolerans]|uniref:glutamate-5-semialdehyde dehydrogenase n=1 Tax=Naumannella halotolerans TaxID=993414 RepID=UPI00105ED239|nr:glutamate-5-semialdehyde dehydrogenase [Naumannella halotolerans]
MSFHDQASRARSAARALAIASTAQKNDALQAMADALMAATEDILAANAVDIDAGERAGMAVSLIDRLRLTEERIGAMAEGLRDLAALPDPVGEVVRGWIAPNGVQYTQVRVPLGVIGMIYEARPNVTADAAGICLKSGNAVLLKGSSSAHASNTAVAQALRTGLAGSAVPDDAVQLLPAPREVTAELMQARGLVDVLIPRGGAGLIEAVVTGSVVPVIETGTGNCHLYVDAAADQQMALQIMINAKVQRPSVCNSLETLLVHSAIAEEFVPKALAALAEHGVTVHGDPAIAAHGEQVVPATEDDFTGEALSLDLSAAVVPDLDAALAHIDRYSTGHSETVVTDSLAVAQRFSAEVDAAAVLVNASSRFVDGGEFGFGAEIGISTQKLHARGPMGLPEMTTTKYLISGQGQLRG